MVPQFRRVRPSLLGLTLTAVFTLIGCATDAKPDFQPSQIVAPVPAPFCGTPAGCEAGWTSARRWVLDNSGYKLRLDSSDYMETFGPKGGHRYLAVRVTRVPVDGGAHRIQIEVVCGVTAVERGLLIPRSYNPKCNPEPDVATADFNTRIAASIAEAEGPHSAP